MKKTERQNKKERKADSREGGTEGGGKDGGRERAWPFLIRGADRDNYYFGNLTASCEQVSFTRGIKRLR